MTQAGLEPFTAGVLPESPDPVAASAAAYANEVVELLSGQLLELVRLRQPDIEPVRTGRSLADRWVRSSAAATGCRLGTPTLDVYAAVASAVFARSGPTTTST